MENEEIYRRIQGFFGNMADSFSLMEDPVDVGVQMRYFDTCSRVRGKVKNEDVIAMKGEVMKPDVPLAKKERLLAQMAGIPNPEIYRAIEAYAKNPDPPLKDWAQIALQENKLLLESDLLDRRQIYISTGLGGKGHKLRYFVVLINRQKGDLKPFQKKIVHDEMEYALKKHDSELEHVTFQDTYITLRAVVPISSDLTRIFREGIDECNQFGNFLLTDFIVTNMKELDDKEIREAIAAPDGEFAELEDDFPPID